jgi:hypothetical protein
VLGYSARNLHMEKQRPEPPADSAICIWCESDFLPAASRARTPSLFCSHRCEVEARFWLVSELQALA